MEPIVPQTWIFVGGDAPYLPRITFDQDKFCLDHDSRVVNRAKPGDSIDIEYKMTPSDTVVSDTLRGWFKAYYRGDIVDLGYTPVTPRAPFSLLRWTGKGVDLPASASGPFLLRDLRGRSIPLEAHHRPEGIRVTPLRPPTPGVYHLTWPGGASTVLIPRL
ncbi:MAG: hypothetical protein H6686_09035 [Fibrobacteria bacterium]|nr:hypothetical protein [Fibrobacteria bacterium]